MAQCAIVGIFAAAFGALIAVVPVRSQDGSDVCMQDAMLVFDASGSMASTDMTGNVSRIHKVREAAAEIVPRVAPFRDLGLIVYGPAPGPLNSCDNVDLMVKPGPNNGNAILGALKNVLPNGRTPMTLAVREAAEALRFRDKPAVVVLLTDGEETCGDDPCTMARKLEAEGKNLTVHVIDYKLRGSNSWQGTFQARCISGATGGLYIAANTTQDLTEALARTLECPRITSLSPPIANQCGMHRSRTSTQRRRRSVCLLPEEQVALP